MIKIKVNGVSAAGVGIIGGADGPTAIFVTSKISARKLLLGAAVCVIAALILATGHKR